MCYGCKKAETDNNYYAQFYPAEFVSPPSETIDHAVSGNKTMVVVDDVLERRRDSPLRDIFTNGRHWRSDPPFISSAYRKPVDTMFILKEVGWTPNGAWTQPTTGAAVQGAPKGETWQTQMKTIIREEANARQIAQMVAPEYVREKDRFAELLQLDREGLFNAFAGSSQNKK